MQKIKAIALLGALMISGAASADLSTGLVAYYPFNGNPNDESGNGNNGIPYGTKLTTDRFGNLNSAYAFDGSTSYIDLTGKPIAQQGSSPRSIFVWSKTTDLKAYQRLMVTGTTGFNQAFNILLWANGYAGIMGYGNDFYTETVSVSDGKWHFIGATYDGNISSIWVDGVLMGSQQMTYNTIGNNNFIGRPNDDPSNAGTESYFNGSIDDIRIYSRALSQLEIEQLYQEKNQGVATVKGAITWIKPPYSVLCKNNTTLKSITVPKNKKSTYDCEKSGLVVNSGDNVTVTITGNKK